MYIALIVLDHLTQITHEIHELIVWSSGHYQVSDRRDTYYLEFLNIEIDTFSEYLCIVSKMEEPQTQKSFHNVSGSDKIIPKKPTTVFFSLVK